VTEARDESPTRRVVIGYMGAKYVVELRKNLILVRPKGTRRGGGAEVSITPSALHDRLLIARANDERKAKSSGRRKRVKRGTQL
jgi:hypothetical protein